MEVIRQTKFYYVDSPASLFFKIGKTDQRIWMKGVAHTHPPQVGLLPLWLETSLTLVSWNLPVTGEKQKRL